MSTVVTVHAWDLLASLGTERRAVRAWPSRTQVGAGRHCPHWRYRQRTLAWARSGPPRGPSSRAGLRPVGDSAAARTARMRSTQSTEKQGRVQVAGLRAAGHGWLAWPPGPGIPDPRRECQGLWWDREGPEQPAHRGSTEGRNWAQAQAWGQRPRSGITPGAPWAGPTRKEALAQPAPAPALTPPAPSCPLFLYPRYPHE